MYLLTLYFPLVSFLFIYFFGTSIGFRGVSFISVFCLSISVLLSLYIYYEVALTNTSCWLNLFYWIEIGRFKVSFTFHYDFLASLMLMMVLLISMIVHIYSLSYMRTDPQKNRFISLLSLFTFFMLLLITSSNFLQLLLGWEGVGICSYLLVNFWADRLAANRAALKALFFNRVGDFGMILALIIMLDLYKTLDFRIIFDLTPMFIMEVYQFGFFIVNKIDLLCFFLVLAAIAKSAQFFLHGWLADAMEGPTPVSALIHAATMVTAGIFLLARTSSILQYSSQVLNWIIIFGVITSIIFSFSGQNTSDLKKIVASSTASQLAYMFFISGLLDNEASIFHLFLHAFFKALLFLSAGSIIHGLGDQQDIRKMGGLFLIMPFNTFCFLIGSLSLIGMPAATGSYYSKDPIIENTFLIDNFFDDFLNIGCELGVVNTFYYNLKLIRIVFFGVYKGSQNVIFHDASVSIMYSLFFLAILSFFSPIMWEFLMSEDNVLSQTYTNVSNFYREGSLNFYREEEISVFLFWLIVLILLFSVFHSEELFVENDDSINGLRKYLYFQEILVSDNVRWGFEYVLVKKVLSFFYFWSNFFFFSVDRGILEFTGPMFFLSLVRKITFTVSKLQTGFLYHYILVFMIGVFFLVFLLIINFSFNMYFVVFLLILLFGMFV